MKIYLKKSLQVDGKPVKLKAATVKRRNRGGRKPRYGPMEAFPDIQSGLPFLLLGADSDNGSECINRSFLPWIRVFSGSR
jgi:hypothetical protein